MKLREMLKRIRLRSLQGEGERPMDTPDAMTITAGGQTLEARGHIPTPAPTNWVPSQQDERPRH